METAVDAGRRSLDRAVTALLAELGAEDPGAWAAVVGEVEESSRSLRERWLHLEPHSPYCDVAEQALSLVHGAVQAIEPNAVPHGIVREFAHWTRAVTSRTASNSIRDARLKLGISLREASRRAGIAAGHLSELEDGRRSLPTMTTAQKLDAALNTDLAGLLRGLRQASAASRPSRRHAIRGTTPPAAAITLDPGLDALLSRIAADDRLVQLNEDILSLSAAARRALAQMIRSIVADLGQSSRLR